jgi:hypothetical protein
MLVTFSGSRLPFACCNANIAGLRRPVFSRGPISFRFARIGQRHSGGRRSAKSEICVARDAKRRVEVDVDGLRRVFLIEKSQ